MKTYKYKWLVLPVLFLFLTINAQVSVTPDGNPSAVLDLNDPNVDNKALMIPKGDLNLVATGLNGASDNKGLLFFNKTDNNYYFYDGTNWNRLNAFQSHANTGTGAVDSVTTDSKLSVNNDLKVFGDAQFNQNGLGNSTTGFVATNTGNGTLGWANPDTLPAIEALNNRVDSANSNVQTLTDNKIFIARRKITAPSLEALDRPTSLMDFSGFVPIRAFDGGTSIVQSGSTYNYETSVDNLTIGFQLSGWRVGGVPLREINLRSGLYIGNYDRIDLPTDGIRRIITVNAHSIWDRVGGPTHAWAGQKYYYIPDADGGLAPAPLISSAKHEVNYGNDAIFTLSLTGSFVHEGDGGYIEPVFTAYGSFDIQEFASTTVGYPIDNVIED